MLNGRLWFSIKAGEIEVIQGICLDYSLPDSWDGEVYEQETHIIPCETVGCDLVSKQWRLKLFRGYV